MSDATTAEQYRKMILEMAAYAGELAAAANHDIELADPADVGVNGISVIEWRRAYFEGGTDMANGSALRVDETMRPEFEATVRSSFKTNLAAIRDLIPRREGETTNGRT